jgi:hypothetical protein
MKGGEQMNIFEKVIMGPLENLLDKILLFLPNLMISVLILLFGIILAMVVRVIFAKIFKALSIDKLLEKTGLMELLRRGGIKEAASNLLSKLIGWIIIIIFAIISMQALRAPAVERLLEQFLLYLPNVFIAILILFLGYLLGNFLGRAALIASVNAGLRHCGIVGNFVKLTVFMLAATMALEQLGIGKDTVIIAFAIIFGGIVFAFALAFGLGGRDAAKEFLDKHLKGEKQKDDISHL